jgi:hypothetical protein
MEYRYKYRYEYIDMDIDTYRYSYRYRYRYVINTLPVPLSQQGEDIEAFSSARPAWEKSRT